MKKITLFSIRLILNVFFLGVVLSSLSWAQVDTFDWSTPQTVTAVLGQTIHDPKIAVDGDGNWHVVYSEAGCTGPGGSFPCNSHIRYKNSNAGSETIVQAIAPQSCQGNSVASPAIAADSNGNLHVAYREINFSGVCGGETTSIRYINNISGSWSTPQTVTAVLGQTIHDPKIAVDGDGNWHVVYSEAGCTGPGGSFPCNSHIRYKNSNAGSETIVQAIAPQSCQGNSVASPAIAADSNGNLHVAYREINFSGVCGGETTSIKYTTTLMKCEVPDDERVLLDFPTRELHCPSAACLRRDTLPGTRSNGPTGLPCLVDETIQAADGVSFEVWCADYVNPTCPKCFGFYRRNSDLTLVGKCWYDGGVNRVAIEHSPDVDPVTGAPACFVTSVWRNFQVFRNEPDARFPDEPNGPRHPPDGKLDMWEYKHDVPPNKTDITIFKDLVEVFHQDPDSGPTFNDLPPVLEDLPDNNRTKTVRPAAVLCDLNGDGKCDTTDVGLFDASIGGCRGDTSYNVLADVNADGCMTVADRRKLFGDDADNDSLPDKADKCPSSDLNPIVAIDGCDSGVTNHLLSDGCTIKDRIDACAGGARNHGQFVSCVAKLTNDLKRDGIISGQEKGAIQSCAAQADIP